MPKVTWGKNFGKETADVEAPEFEIYDGPKPPKGIYTLEMRLLRVKTNKNGDSMLNGFFVIREPKKNPKSKYNGYGLWWQGNVTDQGAGYVNKFLEALGMSRLDKAKFWQGMVILDTDKDEDNNIQGTVLKIAGKTVKIGTLVKAATKDDSYGGETKLQVSGFLGTATASKEDDTDEEDEEEYDESEEDEDEYEDEDEEYDDDDDEDEDEDEEEYDEDEDEVEEEDEEDDEEPEPPKRRSTSRTAGTRAKVPAKAAPARKPAAKAPARSTRTATKKAAPATRRRASGTKFNDEPPF